MKEIKETLTILKTRWVEAGFIIGLMFLPKLLNHICSIYPHLRIAVSLVGGGIFLLVTITSAGFLRTVYLEHNKRQSLLDLMRIGKHFFLRLFAFGLLVGLAVMLFAGLLRITITKTGLDAMFSLANLIGFTFARLLFAKLTLLIPAIIIVLDCSLSKSFGFMWKIKLLKAKPLLIVFLIQIVVLPYLLLLFPDFRRTQPALIWGYAPFMLYSIMLHILILMIQVMAVRFVSSLSIDYNKPYEPPESSQ